MTVTIYKLKNISNNKCYIGSTINFNKRQREHFGNLKRNKHHSIYLQNAYNKYGKKNFIFEEIAICNESVRNFVEKFYIEYYQSGNSNFGYNISLSPDVPNSCIYKNIGIKIKENWKYKLKTKEEKEKRAQYLKQWKQNNIEEVKNSYLALSKTRREKYGIKINKFNFKGEFLEQYNSITEAAEKNNIKVEDINSSYNTKNKGKFYYWATTDTLKFPIKYIEQYTLNNELVNSYPFAREAGRILNISSRLISAVCAGERKTTAGFKWKIKIKQND